MDLYTLKMEAMPTRRFTQDAHDDTSMKMAFFIVTGVKT
jgi:hypothetical protein